MLVFQVAPYHWLKQKADFHQHLNCSYHVVGCMVSEQNENLVNLNVIASLTHWGRVTHICVSKPTTIGSDNGMWPGRRQAIIWTNAEILLIGSLGTNFSEILIENKTFSFKKIPLIMSSGKWRPFCLGLNVSIEDSHVSKINQAIDTCLLKCDRTVCISEMIIILQQLFDIPK